MSETKSDAEKRRAPRVAADFWAMIQGVDEGLVHRRGNVSATGIIFGVDHADDLQIGDEIALAAPDGAGARRGPVGDLVAARVHDRTSLARRYV